MTQLTEDTEALLKEYLRNRELRSQHDFATRSHSARSKRFKTPGALAAALTPSTVQTPALDIIDAALVEVARYIETGEGIDRLILTMPPQEGKSERVTHIAPLWLLQRFPDLRIGLVSYGDEIVRRHSQAMRNDILMNAGQEATLDLGLRLAKDSKASNSWRLAYPNAGSVVAVTIRGGLSGRPLDVLIVDDPVKDWDEAESTVRSNSVWNWWTSTGQSRLGPRGVVIVIQTRWHEFDLTGRLLLAQKEAEAAGETDIDRWHVINIQALADHDPNAGETDILGREPGVYMESARGRTQAAWRRRHNGTPPQQWEALYQGRPGPKAGTIWLKEWWRRYDTPLWTTAEDGTFRLNGYEVSLSVDCAFKDTSASDYVVIQVWAKKGAESFLVYEVRRRLSFTATLDQIKRVVRLFPQAGRKIIEAKANGDAVIDSLQKEVTGMVEANPTQSKPARAHAVSPFIRAGNIKVPTVAVATLEPELAWDVEAYIQECGDFPNGAHDDQVDATSQYLAELYLVGGDMTVSVPEGQIPTGAPRNRPAMQRIGQPGLSGIQKDLTRRAMGR